MINMAEIVPTYLLKDLDQVIPMDRDEFYDEQIEVYKRTGKPSRAVADIKALLFNSHKEAILQKRSHIKRHNPYLLDKTIGGHIRFGDTPNYTLQAETLEELSIPAIVLSSNEDFKKSYRLLKDYLDRSALVQFIDSRTANLKKRIEGEVIEIATKYNFYIGVYGGTIRPADREAAGVMFYSLSNLDQEMKNHPEQFTDELGFFLTKYSSKIEEFLKCLD